MNTRPLAAVVLAAAMVIPLRAADEATLLRVFLTDGTSLVSYGEPAKVSDRVIFSMPQWRTPGKLSMRSNLDVRPLLTK